jgi:hypothetical protein
MGVEKSCMREVTETQVEYYMCANVPTPWTCYRDEYKKIYKTCVDLFGEPFQKKPNRWVVGNNFMNVGKFYFKREKDALKFEEAVRHLKGEKNGL